MGYGMVIILGDHLLLIHYDASQTCITFLVLHIHLGYDLLVNLGSLDNFVRNCNIQYMKYVGDCTCSTVDDSEILRQPVAMENPQLLKQGFYTCQVF